MKRAKPSNEANRLVLQGEMTIFQAGERHKLLLATLEEHQVLSSLERSPALVIDLTGVEEIDTAGLQLLLAARLEARRGGFSLHLVNPSQAVLGLAQLYRLHQELGLESAHES